MSDSNERLIGGNRVHGMEVGARSECAHYDSDLDVVAIKFPCCDEYYSCHTCHIVLAGHPSKLWPKAAFGEMAILCGACGHELTIREYLDCGFRCPACQAPFNPGCANHYGLYFEMA